MLRIIIFLCGISISLAAFSDTLPLVPYPQQLRRSAGSVSPRQFERIVVTEGQWQSVGKMLQRGLRDRNLSLTVDRKSVV